LDALQLGDPRRARARPGADRRGAPVRRREPRGLAQGERPRRDHDAPHRRQGAGRVPRGARVPGSRLLTRVERPQALLEEPLLVTNLVNVRYLTGLASSNAAALVEPDRVRLFTDFRYAERARALDGFEVTQTSRALVSDVAALLQGAVGFEAAH